VPDYLFRNFKWGTKNISGISSNMLFVNNLKISTLATGATNYKQTLDTYDEVAKSWGFDILFPSVSLEDPNLNLPLNLERNGFAEEKIPFGSSLYFEVISHYLRNVDKFDQDYAVLGRDQNKLNDMFIGLIRNSQAGKQLNSQVGIWGLHKEGFLFSDASLIQSANVKKIYLASPFVDSSDLIRFLPDDSVIFKFTNDQIQNKYQTKDRIIYREQQLLNYLNTNIFLKCIFGQNSDFSIDLPYYRLTISRDRFIKINSTNYFNFNDFKMVEGLNSVSFSKSNVPENLEYELNSSDFVVTIDISATSSYEPKSLLSKRWLNELTSPFLNMDTKMK
jgi:hypothetical protein